MENSTGKTLLVLGLGIVAGAALGVLFAPRSGKETRAAIRRKGEDLKDDMDEMIEAGHKEWSKAKGKMSDAATMTKDEVSEFVRYMFKEGKSAAGHMRTEAATAGRNITDKAKKTVEDMKENLQHN
ncbi:MAG: YtxH domain-containing protein [Flavobacteriales bacterium]|nr:YtxH domain-containing protein [Flavobacteriales bacterium]